MRATFDKRLACAINTNSSSLSWLAFLRVNEGEPIPRKGPRMGRRVMRTITRALPDPARQLTSPAIGRAIFQDPEVRDTRDLPVMNLCSERMERSRTIMEIGYDAVGHVGLLLRL